MKRSVIALATLLLLVFAEGGAEAATHYVTKSGNDGNNCTSLVLACLTIGRGMAVTGGGDTLLIGDGTYAEEIHNPPSGSSGLGYTTIQAINDWAVTLDASGFPDAFNDGVRIGSGSYVAVRGLHVKMNQAHPTNLGFDIFESDHVKIQRCSVSYSGVTGNVASFAAGPHNHYLLLEECYAYGGSRYNFLVYQSQFTVVRRCVSRLDYWNGTLQAANFTNYNGDNTVWENNIAIDSDNANIGGSGLYGGFFNENKPPDSSWDGTATRETHRGNITLNVNARYSGIYDYDISNLHTYTNDIVWDSHGGYYGDYVHGDAPVLSASNLTIGDILGTYDGTNGQGSAGTGAFIGPGMDAGTNSFLNSIFWNNPSFGVADYTISDYSSFWNNGANYGGAYQTPSAGAHSLTSNLTAGLKYLPRIEVGSVLSTAGVSGAQVGAEVVYEWGTTGTLWGDTGYDTITTTPLWPFPNEAVIKADMGSYVGPGGAGARGFTTGNSLDGNPQTLTKYIWEYLGNQIPSSVYGNVPSPTPHLSYLAGVPQALIATPDLYNMTFGSLGFFFPTPTTPTTNGTTIPVYIIWYSNPSLPWTTAEKNLTLKWVANLASSQWWTTLRDYPQGFGRTVDQMSLQVEGTVDDPETEGTNFCSGDDAAAIAAAISAHTLPDDPTGLYLVMPSDTDVTFSGCGGISGHHSSTGDVAFASAIRGTWFQVVSPNGDPPYDAMMFGFSHENAEALSFGWFGSIGAGSQEVADVCSQVGNGFFVSNTYIAPNGAAANWTFVDTGVRYDFVLQDLWSREQGGVCNQGAPPPSVLTPCFTNADCSWSKSCLTPGKHCAVKTCSDGIQNGYESDVDCGSSCGINFPKQCANGKKCVTNLDCQSGLCNASTKICQ